MVLHNQLTFLACISPPVFFLFFDLVFFFVPLSFVLTLHLQMGDESDTVIKLSERGSRHFHIMPFHQSKQQICQYEYPMYSSHQQRAASATAEYHVHLQPQHFYLQSLVTSVEIGQISPRCQFCHNTPCINSPGLDATTCYFSESNVNIFSRCKVHECLQSSRNPQPHSPHFFCFHALATFHPFLIPLSARSFPQDRGAVSPAIF